jgi:hypothetical protein
MQPLVADLGVALTNFPLPGPLPATANVLVAPQHAFLWSNGTMTDLGSLPDPSADTVIIGLRTVGAKGCGTSETDSFSPGSHINFTLKVNSKANAHHDGCSATFSMRS